MVWILLRSENARTPWADAWSEDETATIELEVLTRRDAHHKTTPPRPLRRGRALAVATRTNRGAPARNAARCGRSFCGSGWLRRRDMLPRP